MNGRCAGCGEDGELRRVQAHVLKCERWAALFLTSPELALPPDKEYERWVSQDRQGERDQRRESLIADTDARKGREADRFRHRDPLED
jgi:hypothetical protein